MLNTTFALHDVEDVEAFLGWRLNSLSSYRDLSRDQRDDAWAAMLEQMIVLSHKYQPDCGFTFSTMAGRAIPNRLIDYMRRYIKDLRYEHEREAEVITTGDDTLFDRAVFDHEDDAPETHELLSKIDQATLSQVSTDTLYAFAIPLAQGAFIEDLADLNGVKVTAIRKRLAVLEGEVNPAARN